MRRASVSNKKFPERFPGRRQLQLLSLIHKELSSKEIAYEMGLSEGSVKVFVRVLRTRLEEVSGVKARGRIGLALYYERHHTENLEAK